MCIGENGSDTLHPDEQARLRAALSQQMPHYSCTLQTNDDAITWAVLSPSADGELPRFTVCRIAPCIMMMVEGDGQARRFASAASVDEAVAFATQMAHAALFVERATHEAPELTQ